MTIRTILWGLAMACAAMLVYAPFTPRTTWIATSRPVYGPRITEGVGWQGVAAVVGLLIMIALVATLFARQRPSAVFGAALVTVGFVFISGGMFRHAIDLTNGVTSINPGAGWELHPAPRILLFAGIAAAGAICGAALALQALLPAARGTGAGPRHPHL